MPASLSDARLAKRAESIETRDDLKRWKTRSRTKLRFLIISYLFGALPLTLLTFYSSIQSAIKGGAITFDDVLFSMIPGFCCFGPMVLLPCGVLLHGGLNSYRVVMKQLHEQERVCAICETIALFDDKYVNLSKHKGHTAADLVSHMNVIEEDGKVNVLCDACFAEVGTMDANRTV